LLSFSFGIPFLIAASSLDSAVRSNVALSGAGIGNAVLSVVSALELGAAGTGRVAADVVTHGFLALESNVVLVAEARGLLEAGVDNIVVVVSAALFVGLLELVEGTASALVELTGGLSVKSKLLYIIKSLELNLPALVIGDTTLGRRNALVVASVCAQLIAKLDVSALELVLGMGVDTGVLDIIGAGGTGLGLVGVEVLLGLLGDLLVVGRHFDVFGV